MISIHALRVEGDGKPTLATITPSEISIHALRVEGDTHVVRHYTTPGTGFLSTPSGWRATIKRWLHWQSR